MWEIQGSREREREHAQESTVVSFFSKKPVCAWLEYTPSQYHHNMVIDR